MQVYPNSFLFTLFLALLYFFNIVATFNIKDSDLLQNNLFHMYFTRAENDIGNAGYVLMTWVRPSNIVINFTRPYKTLFVRSLTVTMRLYAKTITLSTSKTWTRAPDSDAEKPGP